VFSGPLYTTREVVLMAQGNNTKSALAALIEARRNDIIRDRETSVKRGVLSSLVTSELAEEKPEDRLATLESVARAAWDAGEKNMYDWYSALSKIRDEKLFRPNHKSFEAYLRENWYDRVSRARVWQLISMQRVIEALSETPQIQYPELPNPENKTVHKVDYFENKTSVAKQPPELPKTETQTRELAPFLKDSKEAVREVWKQAQDESGSPQPRPEVIRNIRNKRNGAITITTVDIPPVPVVKQPMDEVTRIRTALHKHHLGWDGNVGDGICVTCGEPW
jgi:hypothetical protein